jgi:hypothetical protein
MARDTPTHHDGEEKRNGLAGRDRGIGLDAVDDGQRPVVQVSGWAALPHDVAAQLPELVC